MDSLVVFTKGPYQDIKEIYLCFQIYIRLSMSNGHFYEFYAPFDICSTVEKVIRCFPRFIPIYKLIIIHG